MLSNYSIHIFKIDNGPYDIQTRVLDELLMSLLQEIILLKSICL